MKNRTKKLTPKEKRIKSIEDSFTYTCRLVNASGISPIFYDQITSAETCVNQIKCGDKAAFSRFRKVIASITEHPVIQCVRRTAN